METKSARFDCVFVVECVCFGCRIHVSSKKEGWNMSQKERFDITTGQTGVCCCVCCVCSSSRACVTVLLCVVVLQCKSFGKPGLSWPYSKASNRYFIVLSPDTFVCGCCLCVCCSFAHSITVPYLLHRRRFTASLARLNGGCALKPVCVRVCSRFVMHPRIANHSPACVVVVCFRACGLRPRVGHGRSHRTRRETRPEIG